MSQPVKLSDGLVLDARLAGEAFERSIAGQVEFWAGLGRAVEPLLNGDRIIALRRRGKAEPLAKIFESIGTSKGKRRLRDYLQKQPYPHFEPAPGVPGHFVRIEANGRRTLGRFVKREFRPAETA